MDMSVQKKIKTPDNAARFVPEVFEDKMRSDTNPGRGWYQVYTFSANNAIDEKELVWSLDKKERLALVLIDISCSRERPLDASELENTERIMKFFSEHKKEMILRPLYDREGKGREKEPVSFSVVLEHIAQLGWLIKKYSDSIHTVQGLFVGSWGEMHSSKYLSDEDMKKLAEALWNATGGKCFLSVRTPLQKRIIESGGVRAEKIALFNDGLFGSETHLGTFGYDETAVSPFTAWTAEKETDYINAACLFTPNGGEAISGGNFTDEEVLDILERMHVSYLNRIYDAGILEKWKNTYLSCYGVSMYEYIGMRLGYRFAVENAWASENEDGTMISLCLRNKGFSCLFRKADVYIRLIIGSGTYRDILCSADMRKLAPGESMLLTCMIKDTFCENCDADIFLVIRHENGEYIRTANAPDSNITLIGKINLL